MPGTTSSSAYGSSIISVPPCDGVVPAQARAWLAHALKYVDERTPADLAAYLRAADYSVFAKACADAEQRIDARAFFRDGLVGDEFEVLRMLYRITRTLSILGRHVEAEPILAELLERCKADNGSRLNGMAHFYLAYQRLDENDLAAARVAIARGIGAFEAVGSPRGYARMLEVRRYVELLEGDRAAAVATCREELGIWRTEVDLVSLAGCLNNVAACLIASDRCDEAAPYAHEAFDLARSLDLPFRIVWSMQHLVAIATLAKVPALDAPCVAQLIGFLDARCRVLGIARDFIDQQEYDRIHALLIDSLSESEMVRLKQRGATLSEADALRFLAVTPARSDPALGGRASRLAGSV